MCGVGSTLNLLVADPAFHKRNLTTLQRIMTGAEVLNVETIRTLLQAIPALGVINGYGPTEATCVCIAHLITAIPVDFAGQLPIGQPLRGIDVQIIRNNEQEESDVVSEVQANQIGGIAVAGDQVMLGYIHRPDLMAERVHTINARQYYLTGDMGYRDEYGLYHFVGREDDEVKIRGYRIHLAEIVAAMHACPGVIDAVSTVVQGVNGQDIAVAFVVKEPAPTMDDLLLVQQTLKTLLPSYMLPRYLRLYTSFPFLPSGKVNASRVRAALKAQIQQQPDLFSFIGEAKDAW